MVTDLFAQIVGRRTEIEDMHTLHHSLSEHHSLAVGFSVFGDVHVTRSLTHKLDNKNILNRKILTSIVRQWW